MNPIRVKAKPLKNPKKKMGRPKGTNEQHLGLENPPAHRQSQVDLNPELAEKLRQAILIGSPVLTAAAFHDISYETMRLWVLKAKENPSSQYGALINTLQKAIAEWEVRDLSVLDAHAHGRPAKYLEQQMRDDKGNPLYAPDGKPLMEYVKDGNGNLIITQSEIKSDWRAALERLSRRKPKSWSKHLNIDLDAILTFTNEEREVNPKEAMTFEQRIAEAVRELEDEV